MGARRSRNLIRAYKDAEDLTYPRLAKRLGISLDYAKKLGSGAVVGVSPRMAKQFERRSGGALTYDALMRWTGQAAPPRRRARTRRSA